MPRAVWPLPIACALLTACGGAPTDPPAERVGVATSAITVQEAVDAGCSTTLVSGLSLQILAQANCNDPDAYVALPPTEGVSLGSAVIPYMQAPARDALAAALESNAGEPMQINSMLRTVAQQYLLYRWFVSSTCGVAQAATPGNSNHETGLAVDVQQYAAWQTALEAEGFSWLGPGDPVHFDYAGPGAVPYDGQDVLAFQQLWNINNPDDVITEDGIYGPQTEARLEASPAEGFAEGAECGDLPNGLTITATFSDADDLYPDGVSQGVVDLKEGQNATLSVEIGGAALDDATLEIDLPPALALSTVDGSPTTTTLVELGDLGMNDTVVVDLSLRAVAANVDREDPDPLVLAVTSVDAEVPVDVYETRAWRFESSRLEGWSASGDTEALMTDSGDLVAEGAGELAVDSPELTIAASSLRQLRLRASREGGEGAASLWWTTDADATFAASRSVPLELPADGDPADVALELSPLGITGTLTGLRVVAFDATSDEATLRIDELELTGDDTVTPPTTGDEAVEDGCGCRIPGDRRTNDPPWMALALGGLLLWRRRRA